MWIAENDELSVEVRYISSVIETPAMIIRKKQQWRKLAISLASGILLAYAGYRLMMRNAPIVSNEVLPRENLPTSPTESPNNELS
jgi:hypothetical protein